MYCTCRVTMHNYRVTIFDAGQLKSCSYMEFRLHFSLFLIQNECWEGRKSGSWSKAWTKMCGGIISWTFVAKNSQLWQNKVNCVKGMLLILAYIHSFISMTGTEVRNRKRERQGEASSFTTIDSRGSWGDVWSAFCQSAAHTERSHVRAAQDSMLLLRVSATVSVDITERSLIRRGTLMENIPYPTGQSHCKYRPIHDYAVTVSSCSALQCSTKKHAMCSVNIYQNERKQSLNITLNHNWYVIYHQDNQDTLMGVCSGVFSSQKTCCPSTCGCRHPWGDWAVWKPNTK